MKITWYGHSCFKLESAGGSIVLDPFFDSAVTGYSPLELEADECLCSHGHDDHSNVGAVKLSGRKSGLEVETISTFHDEMSGSMRGRNMIHIISDGKVSVAHLGDLGVMPEADQMEKLKSADCILVPTGGYYTISHYEANQLARELDTRVVVPMHFRTEQFGPPILSHLGSFLMLRDDVVQYGSNSFKLDKDTKRQTAVLKYQ